VVTGVNVAQAAHTKAGVRGTSRAAIVYFNSRSRYSNVLLVCNRCDKPTRISKQGRRRRSVTSSGKACGERYERGAGLMATEMSTRPRHTDVTWTRWSRRCAGVPLRNASRSPMEKIVVKSAWAERSRTATAPSTPPAPTHDITGQAPASSRRASRWRSSTARR